MEPQSSLPNSQAPATCPGANSIQSPQPLPTSWRSSKNNINFNQIQYISKNAI